jgi:hypothetical protein
MHINISSLGTGDSVKVAEFSIHLIVLGAMGCHEVGIVPATTGCLS